MFTKPSHPLVHVAIAHLSWPINQPNGNFSSSQDASQFLDQKMAPRFPRAKRRAGKRGHLIAIAAKKALYVFCWGGKSCLRRVPKKTGGNDGIPGMKYIYYLYLVVRKWIVCSAPETKDIPIETCFPKRDNIF